MKRLWCWRCNAKVPMLEEAEFAHVVSLRRVGEMLPLKEEFREVLREYNGITGLDETNRPANVYHHRLSMYGPPCKKCGRPLRTPQAKLCGACREPV
jgi:hypothetical protein